jgi:hypothetical protein
MQPYYPFYKSCGWWACQRDSCSLMILSTSLVDDHGHIKMQFDMIHAALWSFPQVLIWMIYMVALYYHGDHEVLIMHKSTTRRHIIFQITSRSSTLVQVSLRDQCPRAMRCNIYTKICTIDEHWLTKCTSVNKGAQAFHTISDLCDDEWACTSTLISWSPSTRFYALQGIG